MADNQTNSPTSIRFNDDEQQVHDWLKDFFGFRGIYGEDSQTVKMAQVVAYNVLRNTFGNELKDIFTRKSRDELARNRAEQQEKQRKGNTPLSQIS